MTVFSFWRVCYWWGYLVFIQWGGLVFVHCCYQGSSVFVHGLLLMTVFSFCTVCHWWGCLVCVVFVIHEGIQLLYSLLLMRVFSFCTQFVIDEGVQFLSRNCYWSQCLPQPQRCTDTSLGLCWWGCSVMMRVFSVNEGVQWWWGCSAFRHNFFLITVFISAINPYWHISVSLWLC